MVLHEAGSGLPGTGEFARLDARSPRVLTRARPAAEFFSFAASDSVSAKSDGFTC